MTKFGCREACASFDPFFSRYPRSVAFRIETPTKIFWSLILHEGMEPRVSQMVLRAGF